MAHFDKIPALLDALVLKSVEGAARSVGMTGRTVWSYLIASKRGDPRLTKIVWHEIEALFHQHYENCKVLAAQMIETSAMERAHSGCLVPSFYQAAPVWLQTSGS